MSGYVRMDEKEAEMAKKYLNFCKEGNLLPERKMVRTENPKISVIIPMYNEEKNILKVLRSIQNQSLQEIEIVCVNDNSKDKTLSMLEDFQKQDPRITIITNKINRGVLYNRIYGAIQSKGEYVTFIDADDDKVDELIVSCDQYSNLGRIDMLYNFDGEEFKILISNQ